ncbi:MAG TPA: sulfite exporter TauE/SafE family protein, partial [Thermodesulfovibrionales bacterium]|nr:sulfite exporter TauE/SafE family protein [Thermodesulfovibrionales bacterium]
MVSISLYLFLVGGSGGFLSGLLGIGGGIVMFPVLLYLPPLLGLEPITVKAITGLTMAQGFFAAFSATFFYKRERLISKRLVFTLGISLFVSSLTGSLLSKMVPDTFILLIFGVLAILAAIMMLVPRDYSSDDLRAEEVSFNERLAVITGLLSGVLLGIVGQGGAFFIIPVLLYVLKIPLRIAFGSTLAIGLLSSGAGLTGKVAT